LYIFHVMLYGLSTTVSGNQNGCLNVWLETESCEGFSIIFCHLYREGIRLGARTPYTYKPVFQNRFPCISSPCIYLKKIKHFIANIFTPQIGYRNLLYFLAGRYI
jgi:hypothetical protein